MPLAVSLFERFIDDELPPSRVIQVKQAPFLLVTLEHPIELMPISRLYEVTDVESLVGLQWFGRRARTLQASDC